MPCCAPGRVRRAAIRADQFAAAALPGGGLNRRAGSDEITVTAVRVIVRIAIVAAVSIKASTKATALQTTVADPAAIYRRIFSTQPESKALANLRVPERDLEERLFYRRRASPRFYTAKTHSGRGASHSITSSASTRNDSGIFSRR
jgi:hypothetical protein